MFFVTPNGAELCNITGDIALCCARILCCMVPARLCTCWLHPNKDLLNARVRAWYMSEALCLVQDVATILMLCNPFGFISFHIGRVAVQTLHLSSSPSSTENVASLWRPRAVGCAAPWNLELHDPCCGACRQFFAQLLLVLQMSVVAATSKEASSSRSSPSAWHCILEIAPLPREA